MNNWDGPCLNQGFNNQRLKEDMKFNNRKVSHKKVFVNKKISTNEFICMLQQKFFPDVEVEDICFYRMSMY